MPQKNETNSDQTNMVLFIINKKIAKLRDKIEEAEDGSEEKRIYIAMQDVLNDVLNEILYEFAKKKDGI